MRDIVVIWGTFFDDRKGISLFLQLAYENAEKHNQI